MISVFWNQFKNNLCISLYLNVKWTLRSPCLCWAEFCNNPLSANPTKWSNALKQFVDKSRRIVWVCLTILSGWRLKANLHHQNDCLEILSFYHRLRFFIYEITIISESYIIEYYRYMRTRKECWMFTNHNISSQRCF